MTDAQNQNQDEETVYPPLSVRQREHLRRIFANAREAAARAVGENDAPQDAEP